MIQALKEREPGQRLSFLNGLTPVSSLAGINPELQYSACFLTVIRLGPRVIIGQQRETGRTTTF